MNRYEKISILKTEEGKRYKKTIKYPLMERSIDDIYIIGMQGDRLDNLAYKYYNDANLFITLIIYQHTSWPSSFSQGL